MKNFILSEDFESIVRLSKTIILDSHVVSEPSIDEKLYLFKLSSTLFDKRRSAIYEVDVVPYSKEPPIKVQLPFTDSCTYSLLDVINNNISDKWYKLLLDDGYVVEGVHGFNRLNYSYM